MTITIIPNTKLCLTIRTNEIRDVSEMQAFLDIRRDCFQSKKSVHRGLVTSSMSSKFGKHIIEVKLNEYPGQTPSKRFSQRYIKEIQYVLSCFFVLL